MEGKEETTTHTPQHNISRNQGGKTIIILVFLFFVAKTFSDTIIVNLLEESTCLVVLKYSITNCTPPIRLDVEGQLQQSAANVIMARSIIEAVGASFCSLFIGPWSDTNGRRPLMLFALLGYTLATLLWCVFSLIPGLHPYFFLLTSIPVVLGGGYVSFFLAIYCYISDTTAEQYRAIRMGWLEAACLGGVLASSLATPYLLKTSVNFGYSIVFATSTLLLFISFLYTYFLIKDSVNVVESERTALWKLEHVVELFKTCFKSRPNHTRTIVLCLIFNLFVYIMVFDGELKVLYMFLQKTFIWDLTDYTRLTSFVLMVAGLSVVASTWFFTQVLKLPDLPVLFLANLCQVMKSLVTATASSGSSFYFANLFGIMTVIVMPLSRSFFSKQFTKDELGKVFAFTSFIESTAPLIAAPLYTSLYKATMDTLPFAIFWLTLGMSVLSTILVGIAMILHWYSNYQQVDSPGSEPLLDDTVTVDDQNWNVST